MPRFIVNPGSAEEWDFELSGKSVSVGRSESNDVQLEHRSVSSLHCELLMAGGRVRLKDLGSTSGTFVNGELVEQSELRSGDNIRVGEVEMRFETDTPVVMESAMRAAEPPLPPRLSVGAPSFTSSCCKFHPQTLARYRCPKCSRALCELCVSARSSNGEVKKFCRNCGVECEPLLAVVGAARERPGFFATLPRAFLYPFQGSGGMLLVAGTAVFFLFGHFPIIGLILTGYLFNYAKSVITTTADERQEPPDWPDFSDWKDDILIPYIQVLALLILTLGPAYLIGVLRPGTAFQAQVAFFAALSLGAFLAPMGMLALAMFDSLRALNPIALVWTIMRVPGPYFVAAASFEVVIVVNWLANRVITPMVRVPIVPGVISSFLSLYLLLVGMRMLGLLYASYRERFGWFRQLPAR